MLSSRIAITQPVVLCNKLNVRKKRIWDVTKPGENAVCSGEFVPLLPYGIFHGFLASFLKTDLFTNELLADSSGSSNSQKRVTPADILKVDISVPSKSEQVKISTILDSIDSLFVLHQRKFFYLKANER